MKTAGALLAAVGAVGLIAATKPPVPVKGVSYRVRTQTAMPNMGGGKLSPPTVIPHRRLFVTHPTSKSSSS
jgi:hypothetical protein